MPLDAKIRCIDIQILFNRRKKDKKKQADCLSELNTSLTVGWVLFFSTINSTVKTTFRILDKKAQ